MESSFKTATVSTHVWVRACVCAASATHSTCVGQKTAVENRFSPPSIHVLGGNSGHQAWQQAPLPGVPFCLPPLATLKIPQLFHGLKNTEKRHSVLRQALGFERISQWLEVVGSNGLKMVFPQVMGQLFKCVHTHFICQFTSSLICIHTQHNELYYKISIHVYLVFWSHSILYCSSPPSFWLPSSFRWSHLCSQVISQKSRVHVWKKACDIYLSGLHLCNLPWPSLRPCIFLQMTWSYSS